MADEPGRSEIFAVNFAALARECAMDILPVPDILRLHQISDEEWARIQGQPSFQAMLAQLIKDWNSAANTKERIRIKAASALEAQLEIFVTDIGDLTIPLNQRVEAGKFLARLGELDGAGVGGGGNGFSININIGETSRHIDVAPRTIEGTVVIPEE